MNEDENEAAERIMAALAAPFPEVKSRQGSGSQTWEYIDPSMAMNRLDDAAGPANWKDQYIVRGDTVECILTIILPGGREIHRSGASAYVWTEDFKDRSGEWRKRDIKPSMVVKTAYSEAFKVACSAFGVGRYLKNKGKLKQYMPSYVRRHAVELALAAEAAAGAQVPRDLRPPESPGSAMVARFRANRYGNEYLQWLAGYGQDSGLPEDMNVWTDNQVKAAVGALNESIAEEQRKKART
jgi:hypothetical protein